MNAKDILSQLTLENYEDIFHSLGIEKIKKSIEYWQLPTICHNLDISNASYKLYFYLNTRTTYCFTECNKSRDIIDLISDRWKLEGKAFRFQDILNYICKISGIKNDSKTDGQGFSIPSWKQRLSIYKAEKKSTYLGKRYDKDILRFLKPHHHQAFLSDGISDETMEKFGIGFYPAKNQITIPVYDLDGKLIGIHCRNLNQYELDKGKKYIPLHTVGGLDYRFKSHEVLYGLNMNEPYIRYTKQIQLFESPKAVLQLNSICSQNTGVGMFGMNLGKQRRDMILKMGVAEVIIGIDKDYEERNSKEFQAYLENVKRIARLFKGYAKCSVFYDKDNALAYKESPTDRGKEVYEKLYKERIAIDV